jgi:opacity protein-like surface antigen
MRSATLLAGSLLVAASASALAAAPSYDYIQIDYVGVRHDDPAPRDQGVDFQIAAQIAPYLILDASYQFAESDHFKQAALEGRIDRQFITAGLEGRLPLVYNQLEAFVGADFVYADLRYRQGFEGVNGFEDDSSNGFQVKGGLRLTGALPYFEAIPTVRYLRVFDDNDFGFGVQLLGCPGHGFCVTGGYEYLKDSKDQRYFGGVRFYYD